MRSVSGTHFFMEEKQMNKCTNCGTEFDGNFCPQCGQKRAGEITCPQCGSKLASDANFCVMCGHKIKSTVDVNPVIKERKRKSTDDIEFAKWLNGILRYVPMALAVLFSVLLPLLYIAPIAEASELMGAAEKINVYSLDEDFYGLSISFLVFMCIALLLAVVLLYLHINKDKRNKYITLFGKVRITVGELAALLAVVFVYLPCLIISAVAMGHAAELNELLGGGLMDAVSAGSAPKAVLSFAVIFTVFAICAVVARILICKANPELLPVDEDDEQSEVKPCRKPLLYYAFLNAKLRRASLAFFMCTFITSVVLTFLFFCVTLPTGYFDNILTMISPHWIIAGGSITTVVVVLLCIKHNDSNWSPDDFIFAVERKNLSDKGILGIKKIVFMFIPLVIMTIYHIGLHYWNYTAYGRGYIMATVYVAVSIIVYVATKVVIAKQSGAIAKYLYGIAGPTHETPLKIIFNREQELAAYKLYQAAKKRGVAIGEDVSVKKDILIRRFVICAACFVFAAISVVSAIMSTILTDKYSSSFVSCVVGTYNGSDDINKFFGKPNEFKNLGKASEHSNNNIYVAMYYDDDYSDLKKNKENLEKQLESAQETFNTQKVTDLSAKLKALETKATNTVFNSLTITYTAYSYNEFNINDIIQIALNTRTTVGKTQKKTTKSVKLFDAEYNENGYTAKSFYAEIFYNDGSYKYERVLTSDFSDIDFNKKGSQIVKWSDEWGSYSTTVKSE